MRDPWRRRCPQGHAALRMHSDKYYCQSCGAYYEGRPHDPKTEDLPVDEEPIRIRETARARAEISPFGVVALLALVYGLTILALSVGAML